MMQEREMREFQPSAGRVQGKGTDNGADAGMFSDLLDSV